MRVDPSLEENIRDLNRTIPYSASEIDLVKKSKSSGFKKLLNKSKGLVGKVKDALKGCFKGSEVKEKVVLEGSEGGFGGLGTFGAHLPGGIEEKKSCDSEVLEKSVVLEGGRGSKVALRFEAKKALDLLKANLDPETQKDVFESLNKVSRGLHFCGYHGLKERYLVRKTKKIKNEDDLGCEQKEIHNSNNNHFILGAFGCKRTNYCVPCNLAKSSKYADKAKKVCSKWMSGNEHDRKILFVTIGFPSQPTQQYQENIELHDEILKEARCGRKVAKFNEELGLRGYTKCTEMMFSQNKVNTHTHALYFCDKKVDLSSEEKIQKYNLEISNIICDYYEEVLKTVVKRARKKNKNAYNWIDLEKEKILKRPELVNGKLRGGVVAEVANSTDKIANYLSKEVALGLFKEGFGTDGPSYSWAGLVKNLNNVSWAREVLNVYFTTQKYNRTFTWSKVSKMSFATYVLEYMDVEVPKVEEPVTTILGTVSDESMQAFGEIAQQGEYIVENILDNLDKDKNYDFEKASHELIEKVPQDEETQKYLKEKLALELKEYSKMMLAEKRKKKLIEDNTSEEERIRRIEEQMKEGKDFVEKVEPRNKLEIIKEAQIKKGRRDIENFIEFAENKYREMRFNKIKCRYDEMVRDELIRKKRSDEIVGREN